MSDKKDKNPYGKMTKTEILMYGIMLGVVFMVMRIMDKGWAFYGL